MAQSRFFEDPTWDEVLKDEATVEEYIKTVADSIWDDFSGTLERGTVMNERIRQQYLIDKKRVDEEGIAPEDIPEPIF